MNQEKQDLFNTYRAAVRWGMYEEAARIQRRMIGLPERDGDPDLAFELRTVEKEPQTPSWLAAIKTLFSRPRNA